jgi:hypothetical protein
MKPLPHAVREFVDRQATAAVADVSPTTPGEEVSPYASYWCRAVGCMLLAGRVQAKDDGLPNRTDINRVCKEANFNQYLFERIAHFLVKAKVIVSNRWQHQYEPGANYAAFWGHAVTRLRAITRPAVLDLVQEYTGHRVYRPTFAMHAGLIEFLTLFFRCFDGRALPEDQVGPVMLAFSRLPAEELSWAARALKLGAKGYERGTWHFWLDEKGQKAVLSALYTAEWGYAAEHRKKIWCFPSPIGLAMLGLGPAPPVASLPTDLEVRPDLAVYAGAGLPLEQLVPLFRHCRIKRIAQVLEFRLEPRRLAEASAGSRAGEELRGVLKGVGPLPSTVADILKAKSDLGGVLKIRGCSALVQPPNPEALEAIRRHPRLKGYLEAGAPPGYLLIKPTSDPFNFIDRCRELGFEVERL